LNKLGRTLGKKGTFTDVFIWMIVSFIVVVISGLFIYMGGVVNDELHASLGSMEIGDGSIDVNETITDTFGNVPLAYQSLYWITAFLIIGMAIAVLIGSALVTTRPVFFIPYIFITIIAIITSTGIANAYYEIRNNAVLTATFEGFTGANYIFSYLPIWVTIIGITGGIIMFVRMQQGRDDFL